MPNCVRRRGRRFGTNGGSNRKANSVSPGGTHERHTEHLRRSRPQRAPARLAAAAAVAHARPLHARAPRGAGAAVPARRRRPRGLRPRRHGGGQPARVGRGGLWAVDADRVLAAPHRLSLRARGRPRSQAALADPRRAPRASQRSQPARHAAQRVDPAGGDLPRRLPRASSARRRGSRCRRASWSATSSTTRCTGTCTTASRAAGSGGACASCTCATTSRTTPAASGSARPTGTASSTPRRSPAARRRAGARADG